MFGWLRELLDIKYEFLERRTRVVVEEKVCQSCEILKEQLNIANFEKRELLNRITRPDEQTTPPLTTLTPIMPRMLPWKVKQQMLQAEDRHKAQLLGNAPKESTEDLEKDLQVAEQTRESEATTKES